VSCDCEMETAATGKPKVDKCTLALLAAHSGLRH
jgi:hypothetical protein